MERTRYIPSIVSLTGGLIACIVTMLNTYKAYEMFLLILAALIVFYIVGAIARKIINKVLFVTRLDDGSEDEEEEETASDSDESEKTEERVDEDGASEGK